MAGQYLEIDEIPENLKRNVHQNLAYKTGDFVWKVRFNTPMNPSTINSSNIYLTSEFGELIKTNIRYDIANNTIEVSPSDSFTEGVAYYLNITTKVQSKGGQKLKAPVKLRFKL